MDQNGKTIVFGSLADQEKLRLAKGLPARTSGAGNVNVGDQSQVEVLELSETSKEAIEQQAEIRRRFEATIRARSINVPTAIDDVKNALREMGHPATLFGENAADRRERLRDFLARREVEKETGGVPLLDNQQVSQQKLDAQPQAGQPTQPTKVFYTPGTEKLKRARRKIAKFSFPRAAQRLKRSQQFWADDHQQYEKDQLATELYENTKSLVIYNTQVGDDRPLGSTRLSPDGSQVGCGIWSGVVKVFDFETLKETFVLRGHTDRVTGIAWNPTNREPTAGGTGKIDLVSGAADQTVRLWSLSSDSMDLSSSSSSPALLEPVRTLKGHSHRLAHVAFHPSGAYVGSASFDATWRLWDVETGDELLLQEGHAKEVYGISFHPDGSLVATGDLNGVCRVWDLRSGKCIVDLLGHVNKVLSLDFSPNGYTLASGSNDHSIRIWDLRKRNVAYVIPAHSNLISDVRFSPVSGEILMSASYDKTAKFWSTRDWSPIKTLVGHVDKVMSCDIHPDERRFITSSYDRTFKIWAHAKEF